jgi:hypothetical protein
MAPPDSGQKAIRRYCDREDEDEDEDEDGDARLAATTTTTDVKTGVTRLGGRKAGRLEGAIPLAAASRGWMHSGKARW